MGWKGGRGEGKKKDNKNKKGGGEIGMLTKGDLAWLQISSSSNIHHVKEEPDQTAWV